MYIGGNDMKMMFGFTLTDKAPNSGHGKPITTPVSIRQYQFANGR